MKKILMLFCLTISLFTLPTNIDQEKQIVIKEKQKIQQSNKKIENDTVKQVECLTDNIYQESRGESHKGKVAVAFVTMNRTRSETFPRSVCEVVKQKKDDCCQFSWYCDDDKRKESKTKIVAKLSDPVYNESYKIADRIYHNYSKIKDPTKGALYYHATYIKKKNKGKVRITKIGKHIFYNIKIKV